MTKRIYLPSNTAENWRVLLADPDKHWRSGFSAKAAAEHWERASGLPIEIAAVFEQAALGPAELLAAFPEWKTPLPGGRRESQTDILALVRSPGGLWIAGVEAKVGEPFGPTVGEWLIDASAGKLERLDFLKRKLRLGGDVTGLRYQLLHRTVAAIIEAERFNAAGAAMIVQSFSPVSAWRADFDAFVEMMGMQDGLRSEHSDSGALLLAWAQGPDATTDIAS